MRAMRWILGCLLTMLAMSQVVAGSQVAVPALASGAHAVVAPLAG